jgi:hypothetical protein
VGRGSLLGKLISPFGVLRLLVSPMWVDLTSEHHESSSFFKSEEEMREKRRTQKADSKLRIFLYDLQIFGRIYKLSK